MKKSRKQICVGPPEERSLCKAASLLRPLYAEAEADRPDALSHAHPDTGATVEALKIFLDVLLPGRMSSDAVRAEELGFFLVRRLSEGWNLLRPEIERAIPFRWIGAASQVLSSAGSVYKIYGGAGTTDLSPYRSGAAARQAGYGWGPGEGW